jgi:DNA polymerase-3 subunit epsilon
MQEADKLHKILNLKRSICFIDLETTGLDIDKDRIVEISICKLYPNGEKEVKTRRINPEIPISQEATDLHGITNEMVINEPTFKKVAKGLLSLIENCDIVGYNINLYDAPLLYNEFNRVDIYFDYKKVNFIDSSNIFKIKEPRTLNAAYKFYCDKDLTEAHSSNADVLATVEIFIEQLVKYDDLPKTVEGLALFSNYDKEMVDITGKFIKDEDGDLVFNFGKHKHKKAKSEPGFLKWMVEKATFSKDVNDIVYNILEEIKQENGK